jgi:hypothetical protein
MTRFARWAVLAAVLVGALLVAVTGASAHPHSGMSGYGEKPPHAHHGCMPLPGKVHGTTPTAPKLPGACRK